MFRLIITTKRYRTFVVWGRSLVLAGFISMLIIVSPRGLSSSHKDYGTFTALGVYTVYLLAATQPGDDALVGRVTERVKYFYIISLTHNFICTGEHNESSFAATRIRSLIATL